MKKGVQGWDPLLAALLCSPCGQRPHSKAVLSVRTAQSQRVQAACPGRLVLLVWVLLSLGSKCRSNAETPLSLSQSCRVLA